MNRHRWMKARKHAAAMRPRRAATAATALLAAACASGCTEVLGYLGEQLFQPPQAPQVAAVLPTSNVSFPIGATVVIQWADVATDPGTVVMVEALRLDASLNIVNTETILSGRDALADADADTLEFDTSGQTAGQYQYRITVSSPNGLSNNATAAGIVSLQP